MLTRRHFAAVLAAGAFAPSFVARAAAKAGTTGRLPGGAPLVFGKPRPFSFERLVATARAKSTAPYVPAPDPAPQVLSRIGYSQHNAIYQPVSGGLFAGPGRDGVVTAFHLGELFRRPVQLNVVADGMARRLEYREDYFSYPAGSPAADMPAGAGFAGLRVHEPSSGNGQPGDWLVFLGASYFRSSGDLRQYGISARGLALDTAAPGGGPEEFPDFTEFWIEEMRGGVMTVMALMESPSLTGAFRFEVSHFPNVVMKTTCRLFVRKPVGRFGVAPLTSMYWYSQQRRWRAGTWRPEIHDSDGLLIRYGRAATWRPLANPRNVEVSAFPAAGMTGFGLMQRDRSYDHYQDAAAFERRPNLFVEPIAGFDEGEVQLVELPTNAEYGDNIVAFFVPEKPIVAGDELAFSYRLHWSGKEPAFEAARMDDMRLARPRLNRPPEGKPRLERKVIMDFSGGALGRLDRAEVQPSIDLSFGRAYRPTISPSVDRADGMRLVFDLFTPAERSHDRCDLRLRLKRGDEPVTETVAFSLVPGEDGPEAT